MFLLLWKGNGAGYGLDRWIRSCVSMVDSDCEPINKKLPEKVEMYNFIHFEKQEQMIVL